MKWFSFLFLLFLFQKVNSQNNFELDFDSSKASLLDKDTSLVRKTFSQYKWTEATTDELYDLRNILFPISFDYQFKSTISPFSFYNCSVLQIYLAYDSMYNNLYKVSYFFDLSRANILDTLRLRIGQEKRAIALNKKIINGHEFYSLYYWEFGLYKIYLKFSNKIDCPTFLNSNSDIATLTILKKTE